MLETVGPEPTDKERARKERALETTRKWQQRNPHKRLFNDKKAGAKKKGTEFTITFEEIKWPTHCPVLGIELDYTRHRGKGRVPQDNSPSFDRIDNSKGYIPGNVKIISHRANTVRNSGTALEHAKIVAYLHSLEGRS